MIEESVASLAERIGGQVVGDGSVRITGVADLRAAGPADLGFVRDARYADLVASSRAGCVLVRAPLEHPVAQIVVRDPAAAFARVAQVFHPLPQASRHDVHPTAVVDPSAELQEPVRVGAHAVIESGARIGAGTVIGSGAFVGPGVQVGEDCVLQHHVVLHEGTRLGNRVVLQACTVVGSDGFGYARDGAEWVRIPQLGGVVLGDDVELGAQCTVDRGALGDTRIGRGTKIDNMVHVGHNCVLGEDCLLAAFSALGGSTILGDRVTFGGHICTAGHIKIASDVRVGGNSGIIADIPEKGDYMGYPVLPKGRWMRAMVGIGKLAERGSPRRGAGE
ncbi:MAG: UDP-3-O-(3-hydroxymyristoyl)glucosamine N-acyltransferase [Planctomycetota bacterium]|nr:UDP-3-O-(3-hydroxymyristoyl)glucosamine N-acyltransferase [Planctomycetota bacterium]